MIFMYSNENFPDKSTKQFSECTTIPQPLENICQCTENKGFQHIYIEKQVGFAVPHLNRGWLGLGLGWGWIGTIHFCGWVANTKNFDHMLCVDQK